MTLEVRIWIFYDFNFGIVYDSLEFISPTPVRDKVEREEEVNHVVFFLMLSELQRFIRQVRR